MLKIVTKFNGDIEILESDVIAFDDGIPGFESQKRFVLLDLYEGGVLKVLQSIEFQNVAFIIGDPWAFKSDYEFDLHPSIIKKLRIENSNELMIYNILTVPRSIDEATINLVAPLIIHKDHRQGIQVVLEGTTYTTRHQIKIKEC